MTTLSELSKAVRPYDPEASRQRRHGMAAGAAAAGAAGLGAGAARGLERQPPSAYGPRFLRPPLRYREVMVTKPKTFKTEYSGKELGYLDPDFKPYQGTLYTDATTKTKRNARLSRQATRQLRRATKGKAAGAVGLAGLAAMLYRRGESEKNQRWR